MNTPKAMYLATYRTNTGAVFSVPVSMDKEIDTVQEYQTMVNTVSKYAVAQEQTRGLDDVSVFSLSLLNPSRDVDVIANELLEKAFVEMYDQWPTTSVSQSWTEMYHAIKGADNNG